jgi:hypothetical protein
MGQRYYGATETREPPNGLSVRIEFTRIRTLTTFSRKQMLPGFGPYRVVSAHPLPIAYF